MIALNLRQRLRPNGQPHGHRRVSGVYMISNVVTGRCYVGASVDVRTRYLTHMRNRVDKKAPVWSEDLAAHGAESFRLRLLEVCPREAFDEREQAAIDLHRPAYNRTRFSNQMRALPVLVDQTINMMAPWLI